MGAESNEHMQAEVADKPEASSQKSPCKDCWETREEGGGGPILEGVNI